MKDVPLLVAVVVALILAGTKWRAEHLRFETGSVSVETSDEPRLAGGARVSSQLLEDGRLLVVAGPLSFSDLPRHLVLILASDGSGASGWRVAEAGVRWTLEVPESSRWIEPLCGTVRIESNTTAEGQPFRCAVDLWCDHALEGRFALACTFQHVPGFESENAAVWAALLETDPLPSR